MTITDTLVSYYLFCKRRCWLHANGIRMEDFSDTVYEGKLIGETTYLQRPEKYSEVSFSANWNDIELSCKIDDYDAKTRIVHETKKSDSFEFTHEWQVKFYLWLIKLNGVDDVTAILEYPRLRKTDEIKLLQRDIEFLEKTVLEINKILKQHQCPGKINAKICKSCSYFDFCYSGEEEL